MIFHTTQLKSQFTDEAGKFLT